MKPLATLAEIHELFETHRLEYWLFGGWAVDFHVGAVTREHDDIDIAVWARDLDRITELLGGLGWRTMAVEDGHRVLARGDERLDVALLARDESGEVYTPLSNGRGTWTPGAFTTETRDLDGVRAHVITGAAVKVDKSGLYTEKDRVDLAVLAARNRR